MNEAAGIGDLLNALREQRPRPEIIVADGGSEDDTLAFTQRKADVVLSSTPGRGAQLNAGAAAATGDILWFVHADSQILPGSTAKIIESLSRNRELAGGAFRLKFDDATLPLSLIACGANFRSRFLKRPWGDQGIFIRRDQFESLGGFPDWPLLEDHEFMRRLNRQGKTTLLPLPIITSARRYRKLGLLKTVLINFQILWWFRRGFPIEEIQRRFRPRSEQGGGAGK